MRHCFAAIALSMILGNPSPAVGSAVLKEIGPKLPGIIGAMLETAT